MATFSNNVTIKMSQAIKINAGASAVVPAGCYWVLQFHGGNAQTITIDGVTYQGGNAQASIGGLYAGPGVTVSATGTAVTGVEFINTP